MKTGYFTAALGAFFLGAISLSAAPHIQFETNFHDFGKTVGLETLKGTFKFKNTGDQVLKVQPPRSSCDCTVPQVVHDSLQPGESSEVSYVIRLDHALNGQRHIRVRSNDPSTPEVELTVQLNAVPLYENSPRAVRIVVPAGKDEASRPLTITRTDSQPVAISRITTSQPWIAAALDPSFQATDSSGKINITVHRPSGPPGLINESIKIWGATSTEDPIRTVAITGEVQGEVAAEPSRLYWIIPDYGKAVSAYPPESLTRDVELRSVLGHEVQITEASSDIKGMSIKVVPKQAGQRYSLVLKFDQPPQGFTNGKLTIATSLPTLPKLEVPLTISAAEAN